MIVPKFSIILTAVTFLLYVQKANSLECYVCDNQEDNTGKCVKTIKTCLPEEDVCLTEMRWGSTPYWQQGALKQYYISKRCASRNACERYRSSNMVTCTHIWYQDWTCSECCRGDRCNYYFISGGTKLTATTTILSTFIALAIYFIK